ncbi:hypothetical protein, partial [Moorena bouillonii]|uniref:hypothetical protein n=1 Tax=Moorena bouillonii TaxID=207920 RepID=UPI001300EF1A
MSKTNNTMRLSPLLAAMIAATASIGVSKPSRGQTIQSLPDAPQQNSSDLKTPPVVAHGGDPQDRATSEQAVLDAVAHGEGLCAEPASAPCKPRGNPQDRNGAFSVGELN